MVNLIQFGGLEEAFGVGHAGDIEEQFTHGGEAGDFPGIVFEVLVEYMAGDAVGVAFDGVVEKSCLAPVGSGEEVLCPGAGVLVEFEGLGDLLVEGLHRGITRCGLLRQGRSGLRRISCSHSPCRRIGPRCGVFRS